jgi:hypothetical protein
MVSANVPGKVHPTTLGGSTIHCFHESRALNGYLKGGIISNSSIKQYRLLPNIPIFAILCVPVLSFNFFNFFSYHVYYLLFFYVLFPTAYITCNFLTKLGI